MLVGVVKHHPDGAFAQFREYLLARDMGSILFQKEPSDKPGTIQLLHRGLNCGFGAGGRFMGLGSLQFLIACAGIPKARGARKFQAARSG
jgi:hypothetical protein